MPLSAASIRSMILGVTAARGTTVHVSERYRISPARTACTATPLSTSVILKSVGRRFGDRIASLRQQRRGCVPLLGCL